MVKGFLLTMISNILYIQCYTLYSLNYKLKKNNLFKNKYTGHSQSLDIAVL